MRALIESDPRLLEQMVRNLLGNALESIEAADGGFVPVIFVVDDGNIRDAIRSVLEDDGLTVEDFATCEAFLEAYRPGREACLLVDAYLPGMSGLNGSNGSTRVVR